MDPSLLFAGASSGLQLMSGLFGYLASGDIAAISESRARMIRAEAEAQAQNYAEQSRLTLAKTKAGFLKSGVYLSGSPLDVLAHDALTAQENISAIRATGRAQAFEQTQQAAQARTSGRMALLNGITGGLGSFGKAAYGASKSSDTSGYNRKSLNSGASTGFSSAFLKAEGWQ